MAFILRLLKKITLGIFVVAALLTLITVIYMRQDKFGKAPANNRLARIEKSPHFKQGKFQNLSFTPELTEGNTILGVTYRQLFAAVPRRRPVDVIPSVKTDLLSIPVDSNYLVWFGHSSYLIQIDGKRILVDPVFSGNASPLPYTNTSFKGTDIYTADDLPEIDYLFISHDHYDHVDYETLLALRKKVKKVICGLGVGAHFEQWGYDSALLDERDWYETIELEDGFKVFTEPARHFSGRGFTRNNTLWMSYVVQTPTMKFYIGGDSGYDTHYAEIGRKHGPIDLVMLDNGQYNTAWQYIHNLPREVVQAAKDLQAKRLFPVHSSKFMMANHPWDEPLIQVSELNAGNIPLVTPIIGELVDLNDTSRQFKPWWEGIN
ncbi:MAG TPA: MBL fold metallo-hydrolase [Chryseolinea sp.]|nr:MBL fold metallo-hydrolase [Chryseolinea sp.]